MQLSALQAAAWARLGVPSTDAFHTAARLTQHINSAIQYISAQGDWEWLEKSETIATIIGTQGYAVAADALRTVDVLDATGLPLVRKPIDELDYMGTASRDTPRWYSQYKNTLVLFPIPATVQNLKHRYVASEVYLAGSTDTPLITAQWQEAIIDRTCYLAEMSAGNDSAAQTALASFNDWLTIMHARADRRADTTGGGQEPAAAAKATAAP